VIAEEATLGIRDLLHGDTGVEIEGAQHVIEAVARAAASLLVLLAGGGSVTIEGVGAVGRGGALPNAPVAVDKVVVQEEGRVAGRRAHVVLDAAADGVVAEAVHAQEDALLHLIGSAGIDIAAGDLAGDLLVAAARQAVVGVPAAGADMQGGRSKLLAR
jgi:hypothetical protein